MMTSTSSPTPSDNNNKSLENDIVLKSPTGIGGVRGGGGADDGVGGGGLENNAYFPVDHVYDEINYMDNSVPKAPRRKLTPQFQQFIV